MYEYLKNPYLVGTVVGFSVFLYVYMKERKKNPEDRSKTKLFLSFLISGLVSGGGVYFLTKKYKNQNQKGGGDAMSIISDSTEVTAISAASDGSGGHEGGYVSSDGSDVDTDLPSF